MNILQLIDVNGRSGHLDPTLHFSADYVEWIKQQCIQMAKEKHVRLMWTVAGSGAPRLPQGKGRVEAAQGLGSPLGDAHEALRPRLLHDGLEPRSRQHPGSVHSVLLRHRRRPRARGSRKQDFDEIWNSPNAVDLRRSMATWDYPALCSTCYFTDKPGPEAYLPFVDDVLEVLGRSKQSVDPRLVVKAPEHMVRIKDAPTIVSRTRATNPWTATCLRCRSAVRTSRSRSARSRPPRPMRGWSSQYPPRRGRSSARTWVTGGPYSRST